MTDIIIIIIVALIVGLAAGYVYKAKKNGKKCIGCPGGGCAGCGGACGMAKSSSEDEK